MGVISWPLLSEKVAQPSTGEMLFYLQPSSNPYILNFSPTWQLNCWGYSDMQEKYTERRRGSSMFLDDFQKGRTWAPKNNWVTNIFFKWVVQPPTRTGFKKPFQYILEPERSRIFFHGCFSWMSPNHGMRREQSVVSVFLPFLPIKKSWFSSALGYDRMMFSPKKLSVRKSLEVQPTFSW